MTRLLKYVLPVVGFVAGVLLVAQMPLPVEAQTRAADYIPLALLAGFDSICGGIRSGLRGRFRGDIFLSGFLVNVLLAVLFVVASERLGVELHLAAVVVLGSRIFINLSLIRRELLDRWRRRRDVVADEEPLVSPERVLPL